MYLMFFTFYKYFLFLFSDPVDHNNARVRLEEKKIVIKSDWKLENFKEVQRQFRKQFNRYSPTGHTISRIRDKFRADGTVHGVH